jgi:hypothetical protein
MVAVVVIVVVVVHGNSAIVVSGCLGAGMFSFNTRERLTAEIIKAIKGMSMFRTQ